LTGLDWLRAGATVLVVMLHAGIPYMEHPMPGLSWAMESTQRSGLVDLFCWSVDGFIMPLFFLMSGYFAAGLLRKRGADAFISHRLKRLGGPFLLGCVLILPLDLYTWLLGWVHEGWIPWGKLRSLKLDTPRADGLFGFSHLWFLEYLILYCGAAWTIRKLMRRFLPPKETTVVRGQIYRHALMWQQVVCLLAATLVGATCLWLAPRVVIGFRHGWLPRWENLLYFSVPFTMGWFWDRRVVEFSPAHRWALQLVAAIGVGAFLWPRLIQHIESETAPVTDMWVPVLFTLFSVLVSSSCFGIALQHQSKHLPKSVDYLAKASFWIYLFHHPVVGLTHVALDPLDWAVELKFALTSLIAMTLSLLTYEVFVRRTIISVILNGHREAPKPVADAEPVISKRAA